MFRLYILDHDALDTELVYSFSDLLQGFVRYKDEAEKRGIEIVYEKNVRSEEILRRGDKVDCFFTIIGGMIDYNGELYKNRLFKTATFLDDIHWWTKESLENRLALFEKTDFVFTPYARTANTYKEYEHLKEKFIPLHWWAPDVCFSYEQTWEKRIEKILLSGSISLYPIRRAISQNKHPIVDHLQHSLRHPNFIHPYHGVKFYEYLSKYKGAISASAEPHQPKDSIYLHQLDYTLSKNFEVLGCGCLGFLEETVDFKDLGFKAYENFIPITLDSYNQQWKYLFDNKAKNIVFNGREFVKKNHSTKNRIIQILEKIK